MTPYGGSIATSRILRTGGERFNHNLSKRRAKRSTRELPYPGLCGARYAAARLRAVASRMRLRKRSDFGVASTYSSMSMYSIARSRLIRSGAFKLNSFAFTLAAHVRKMFCLAGIDRQIFRTRVFAHDHSFVNVLLWTNEKPAALLNVVECVSSADSRTPSTTITPRPRPPISPLNGAYSRKR